MKNHYPFYVPHHESIGLIAFLLSVLALIIQGLFVPYRLIEGLYKGDSLAYIILFGWIALIIVICRVILYFRNQEFLRLKEQYEQTQKVKEEFYNGFLEITVEEFRQGRRYASEDVTGVYVIHNITKNMYYVGQATNVSKRLNDHFNGNGNGDVYADYKYGDEFRIRIIPLVGSGYRNLNKLESDTIAQYDACRCGYNKTRGNGSMA